MNRLFKHSFFVLLLCSFGCTTEDVVLPDYEEYTAEFSSDAKTIEVQKVGNSTEVDENLLPTLKIQANTVSSVTRVKSLFRNINSINLPDSIVSISDENYMWHFNFSSPLQKEVNVEIPYSKDLGKRFLQTYRKRFEVYSCDLDFKNWRKETFINDTLKNVAYVDVNNVERYYGVFFEEILFKSNTLMQLDLSSFYDTVIVSHVAKTGYFSNVPVFYLDNHFEGAIVDSVGEASVYILNVEPTAYLVSSRSMLDFQFDGLGKYTGDEFLFYYGTNLFVSGSWQNIFESTDDTEMYIEQWGEIGEPIVIRIIGDLRKDDSEDIAVADMYIKTIRCR